MVLVARRARFSAGRRLFRPEMGTDENLRIFGPCARDHGHDYVVDATVRGEIDARTGMVVNITRLKSILAEFVVGELDGEFLTATHPFCRGQVPTVENLAHLIWRAVDGALRAAEPAAILHRLRLAESRSLAAECCRKEGGIMLLLTRSYEFSAAHRLHSPSLSDEDNLALFGKCNNPSGHGHNYVLEVTISGEPDPRTGMVAELAELDATVHEEVVDRYDHHHLNQDTPEFRGLNPTSENLVRVIWERLEKRLERGALYKVTLHETERNTFAYYGEDA